MYSEYIYGTDVSGPADNVRYRTVLTAVME